MTDAPPPTIAASDPQIDCDTPCVRCAYNLRGLTPQSHCPECGLPAAHSLPLPDGRPRLPVKWLLSLARGARLLAWCYAMPIALMMLAVSPLRSDRLCAGMVSLWPLLLAGSSWRLTRPERSARQRLVPDTAEDQRMRTLRLIVLAMGLVTAAMAIATCLLAMRPDDRASTGAAGCLLATAVISLACLTLQHALLRCHATRVGRPDLASCAKAMAIIHGIAGPLAALAVIVNTLGQQAPLSPLGRALAAIMLLPCLVAWIVSPVYLAMLARHAESIVEDILDADRTPRQ